MAASAASEIRPAEVRFPRWLRRTLGLLVTIVAPALLFPELGFRALSMAAGPYAWKFEKPFTREAWLAANEDNGGARFLMLDDLTSKHPLVGMKREEVLSLLGPMQPPGFPSFDACYHLGPENHLFAIDSAWLVLTFENDVVTAWRVGTD